MLYSSSKVIFRILNNATSKYSLTVSHQFSVSYPHNFLFVVRSSVPDEVVYGNQVIPLLDMKKEEDIGPLISQNIIVSTNQSICNDNFTTLSREIFEDFTTIRYLTEYHRESVVSTNQSLTLQFYDAVTKSLRKSFFPEVKACTYSDLVYC